MLRCVKEDYLEATSHLRDVETKHGTPRCVPRAAAISAAHVTRVLGHGQGDSAVEQLKVIPFGRKAGNRGINNKDYVCVCWVGGLHSTSVPVFPTE